MKKRKKCLECGEPILGFYRTRDKKSHFRRLFCSKNCESNHKIRRFNERTWECACELVWPSYKAKCEVCQMTKQQYKNNQKATDESGSLAVNQSSSLV